MPKIFVANDGSWGDADLLRIIDITDEQAEEMAEMSDSEIAEFATAREAEQAADHNASQAIEFRDIRTAITLRSTEFAGDTTTNPDTRLVFIDTQADVDLVVYLNDDAIFDGQVR